jgi:phosphopantothenoylcysteine synthetase/decarboxylase
MQAMNVVVTGGGTVAPIDDVRHIANASSGRFSAMITEACLARGAHVWHIHTAAALRPIYRLAQLDLSAPDPQAELDRLARLRQHWLGVRDRLYLIPLAKGTVADYAAQLEKVLRTEAIDVAFLAMAVSDFEPEPVSGKLSSRPDDLILRCHPSPKVILRVREWSPGIYLVGFKLLSRASDDDLVREAEAACRANGADATVANDLQTVQAGRHTIHLVRPGHPPERFGPEGAVAERLVERVFGWAAERPKTESPRRHAGS